MVRKTTLNINGITIPVKVKIEWRKSVRYSINKKSINILLPKYYTKDQVISEFEKLKEWCLKQFNSDPSLLDRFTAVKYKNNGHFEIYGQNFKLLIFEEKRKTSSAYITKHKEVVIKTPNDLDEETKNRLIGMVLSRVFSNYFQDEITDRVEMFNQKYFKEEIEAIRLKNNQSNWGSCSSKKNINLSSRLLFAPQDVIDYVIIHELSHLKEMNHSPRFWKIVEDVMPDYQEKESWLTKHGNTLKF